jgi:hypothetical protein
MVFRCTIFKVRVLCTTSESDFRVETQQSASELVHHQENLNLDLNLNLSDK